MLVDDHHGAIRKYLFNCRCLGSLLDGDYEMCKADWPSSCPMTRKRVRRIREKYGIVEDHESAAAPSNRCVQAAASKSMNVPPRCSPECVVHRVTRIYQNRSADEGPKIVWVNALVLAPFGA